MPTEIRPLRPAGGTASSNGAFRSWTEALQTHFSEDQVSSIRGPSRSSGELQDSRSVRAAMSRSSSVQHSSRASSKRWREEPSEVLLEVDSVDGTLPPGLNLYRIWTRRPSPRCDEIAAIWKATFYVSVVFSSIVRLKC